MRRLTIAIAALMLAGCGSGQACEWAPGYFTVAYTMFQGDCPEPVGGTVYLSLPPEGPIDADAGTGYLTGQVSGTPESCAVTVSQTWAWADPASTQATETTYRLSVAGDVVTATVSTTLEQDIGTSCASSYVATYTRDDT